MQLTGLEHFGSSTSAGLFIFSPDKSHREMSLCECARVTNMHPESGYIHIYLVQTNISWVIDIFHVNGS